MPKNITAFVAKISDLDIVLASLALSLLFFIILFAIVQDLLEKLEIRKIIKVSVPIFFVFIFVVFGFASYLSTNSRGCKACHQMRPAIRDLAYTSHRSISCLSCHKKAGIFGLAVQNLSQIRMTISYIRKDYSKPITSFVSNDVCLSCHKNISKGIKVRLRVKMSHAEVIDEKIACTECHTDIAHYNSRKRISKMEKCSSCHNDEKVSARCEMCHLDKVWLGMKPMGNSGIVHDKNWQKLHGSRSLYICRYCHKDDDCNKCHVAIVPHPEGWPYIHSDEAKSNRDDCQVCHKKEGSCLNCHKVIMPHQSNWLAIHHLKVKAVGQQSCMNCHNKKDCADCHKKHKKSLKLMKPSALIKRGSN